MTNANATSALPSRHRTRLRRVVWVCAALAAAIALGAADRAGLFGQAGGSDELTYHETAFTVDRIVDGDTLDVAHPDTVARRPTTRVRLLGIDTPETVRPNTPVQHFGPEAAAFTHELASGERVRLRLVPGGRSRGSKGRLLAYVILPDGRMLNRELVALGYAYADPRYKHPLRAEMMSAMAEARKAGRGLWDSVTEADLPYYLGGPDRW